MSENQKLNELISSIAVLEMIFLFNFSLENYIATDVKLSTEKIKHY